MNNLRLSLKKNIYCILNLFIYVSASFGHRETTCPTETRDKISASSTAASFNKKTARNKNNRTKKHQKSIKKTSMKTQILGRQKIQLDCFKITFCHPNSLTMLYMQTKHPLIIAIS